MSSPNDYMIAALSNLITLLATEKVMASTLETSIDCERHTIRHRMIGSPFEEEVLCRPPTYFRTLTIRVVDVR